MSRRAAASVTGVVAVLVVAWLGGPWAPAGAPTQRNAETVFDELVVSDPAPRIVVFELGDRLVIDRLVIDRSPYLDVPMPPRWRVTGREWFSVPASGAEAGRAGIAPAAGGAVHVFGRFSAGLVGRVAGVAIEPRPGKDGVRAIVVGERGFLVAGHEGPLLGQVILLDEAGGELGTVEPRPADG